MAAFVHGGKKDFLLRNNSRQSGQAAYRSSSDLKRLREIAPRIFGKPETVRSQGKIAISLTTLPGPGLFSVAV